MENNLWIAGYSALVTGIITFMVPGTVMMKRRARNAVEKATYYDDLCSIKNHKGFMKDAGQLLRDRTGQMAFAYIDIDNFRMINSVYSFQYGNEVLVRLSEAIREVFGDEALVGRFSGDAFGVLCHCRSCEDITGRIHQLQAKVNQKCHEGKDLVLACGIHFISDEESQLDIIFDKANIARRSVKNLSNTIFSVYDEDYGKKLHEENVLTEEIKEALKKKSFDVYYQPKFEFAQRKIVASEALIRWEHKEKGFISPATFIPVAEKTQLIVEIGRFVFDRVCSDIRRWSDDGMTLLPVSVNISRIELLQEGLMDFIKATVEKYGVDYSLIEIEITETAAVADYDRIEGILREIKSLGMSISIDDFGAGYSSLGCLNKLHVDTLKIDRSLITDLSCENKGRKILQGMIELSKNLELKTICEGIETEDQFNTLEMFNCDYGQGFLFARPMKEADFRRMLIS